VGWPGGVVIGGVNDPYGMTNKKGQTRMFYM
jgi:hypothetical protein